VAKEMVELEVLDSLGVSMSNLFRFSGEEA